MSLLLFTVPGGLEGRFWAVASVPEMLLVVALAVVIVAASRLFGGLLIQVSSSGYVGKVGFPLRWPRRSTVQASGRSLCLSILLAG